MKRENLRRRLFVSAACLFSFPWLTPCVGIWSAAAVNGVHDSVTKRDEPLNRVPDPRLKEWAAKQLPRIAILPGPPDTAGLHVTEEEVSARQGGRSAAKPGTMVGKGASALVDGITYALTWADPFTWVSGNSLDMKPTKPDRRLVLCQSPFVMIEAQEIRFVSAGKAGGVRLARASNAKVSVITPEGAMVARARYIHYRGPSEEVVLETPFGVYSETQNLLPARPGSLMRLNFVKRGVSSPGGVVAHPRHRIDSLLLQKQPPRR